MLYLIVGRKGTGKDTIADILQEEYDIKHRFALADALKEFVKLEHNISSEDLVKNKEIHRPRLVATGDNFKKIFGELFFSEVIKKKILDILKNDPDTDIIITDVRLHSEFEHFKDLKHISIKMLGKEDSKSIHRTETESDSINTDIYIVNEKDGIDKLKEIVLDDIYKFAVKNDV